VMAMDTSGTGQPGSMSDRSKDRLGLLDRKERKGRKGCREYKVTLVRPARPGRRAQRVRRALKGRSVILAHLVRKAQ
jgi:hypothetical protein